MKNFKLKTVINFGTNALSRLSELGCKKAFIVTDPFIVSSGMINYVLDPLKEAGVSHKIYSNVVPNPPIESVIEGVKELSTFKSEFIIAVGGGSAIDTAKAIIYFSDKIEKGYLPKLVCIPTTSGTGSEVTSFAVLSDHKNNRKIPLVSEKMMPDEAILDEILVKSVPKSVVADTGMDVFTHAIEAYVSKNNNEFSGALAEKSVEICGNFLLHSYKGDMPKAKRKMHIASCLAGIAFNSASLGLNHGMAHQLGAQFNVPHGRANAILLPYIIDYNTEPELSGDTTTSRCLTKYCNMARVLGIHTTSERITIKSFMSYLQDVMQEMQMPLKVSDIKEINKEDYFSKLDEMAEAALKDTCTATNPRVPTKEDVIKLYKMIW